MNKVAIIFWLMMTIINAWVMIDAAIMGSAVITLSAATLCGVGTYRIGKWWPYR